jgi:hypothetical protein
MLAPALDVDLKTSENVDTVVDLLHTKFFTEVEVSLILIPPFAEAVAEIP